MANELYSFAPQSYSGLQAPANFASMGNWGMPAPMAMPVPEGYAGQGLSPAVDLYQTSPALANMPGFGGLTIANMNGGAVAQPNSFLPDFLKGAIGTKEAPGWGGMALGAASGLASAWLGMKQYGIAKQTLEENKRQFQLNYDAQRQTTNTRLEDRQRARVASNPGAYESLSDYMNKNGVR
jgi:hypothetical protein